MLDQYQPECEATGEVLLDTCLGEIRKSDGILTETLWQDWRLDDEDVYAIVDGRTNNQVGLVGYYIVAAELEEDVIYRIHPFAASN